MERADAVRFTGLEQFERFYFPAYCKKYPITIRVNAEERSFILHRRGAWIKKAENTKVK